MKRTLISVIIAVVASAAFGQSWNPYVNQGTLRSAPLLPLEFGGKGVISLNIGNSGSNILICDQRNDENNLMLEIKLSNGVPDKNNPLSALGGTWFSYFKWSYNSSARTYTAIQKRNIPPYSQGTITVEYKVDQNSPSSGLSNGFQAELKVPSYMNVFNNTQDDMVKSYTFTRAYDFGDAPASYGSARHEINLNRDPETGKYTRYIFLGKRVDQENDAVSSDRADGDDRNNSDDEDGVLFPILVAGTTVTIPVVVTAVDGSYGLLNAWFDWNGDGDFTDPGEKAGTPLPVYSSGTYMMKVAVPATAATRVPSYARFRIGANGGPTAPNAWGECEDYQVQFIAPSLLAKVSVANVQKYGGSDGLIDLTVSGGITPYKFAWNNGATTEDLVNIPAGTYSVMVTDAINSSVSVTATVKQPSPSGRNELAVNSVSLSGERKGADINLLWVTPAETNTSWFIVERSIDAGEFVPVGDRIPAAGSSLIESTYTYIDPDVKGEIVSYRIRLIDSENRPVLSNTITELLDSRFALNVSVYPNPVSDRYFVAIDNDGDYLLELTDAKGKIVNTSTMNVHFGTGKIEQFYRNRLVVGQYFLRITDKASGKSKTIKLIMAQ